MRILPVLGFAALLILSALATIAPQEAEASPATVYCRSVQGKYTECSARFTAPVLVMQKSRAPCILNNSWGYNPDRGRLWVARGCVGVFADQGGYHYGQTGEMDVNARRYSDQGAFIGYGPTIVVQKNVLNNQVTIQRHQLTVIDNSHEIARITNPRSRDEIDMTPQFDRNGEPNFDTHGNYIGAHGLGSLVDSPEPVYEGGNYEPGIGATDEGGFDGGDSDGGGDLGD